jgi:NAD(P)-dependent dehydrogenase (short-subunit alcohol dehydrogenase family)
MLLVCLYPREKGYISSQAWIRVPDTLGIKLEELKIIGIPCNVTSEEEVVAAYDKTLQTFGHIDVVVASAGECSLRFSGGHGSDVDTSPLLRFDRYR